MAAPKASLTLDSKALFSAENSNPASSKDVIENAAHVKVTLLQSQEAETDFLHIRTRNSSSLERRCIKLRLLQRGKVSRRKNDLNSKANNPASLSVPASYQ
jgi:hypothetical protein